LLGAAAAQSSQACPPSAVTIQFVHHQLELSRYVICTDSLPSTAKQSAAQ